MTSGAANAAEKKPSQSIVRGKRNRNSAQVSMPHLVVMHLISSEHCTENHTFKSQSRLEPDLQSKSERSLASKSFLDVAWCE